MQPPDVYLVPESPGELDVVNVRGGVPGLATLVIGRKLFETESDIELAFIVGRTLAAVRPDHLLRWPSFVPTLAELEIAVRAAIRLVDPERPIPAELTPEVEQYAGFLSRTMPPQVLEQVSVLVKRFGGRARRRSGRRRHGAAALGARRLPDHDPRGPAARRRSRGGGAAGRGARRRPSASIPPTWSATVRLEHLGRLLGAAHGARPAHDQPVAARCRRRALLRAKGGTTRGSSPATTGTSPRESDRTGTPCG